MSETIIKVENLSKRYRIGAKEERYKTLREAIVDGFKAPIRNFARLRKLTKFDDAEHRAQNAKRNPMAHSPCSTPSSENDDTIWALRDVSLEVREGEVLGIIGRNGAGKTTLLKILSRITGPTSGDVKLYGRVSSLLEVGTGFHPELTGRENVFLNGTILGMRRAEIDRKFDEIIDFSGVEKFIDTPVKRYSSGMQVRLAFAVAAHLEPEILLIDEVLAVGDVEFQKKCLGKMKDVAGEGRTVLFVSHNMAAVNNLCQSGVVIEKGEIVFNGQANRAINFYLRYLNKQHDDDKVDGSAKFPIDDTKTIQILEVSLVDSGGRVKSVFDYNEHPFVNILFDLRVPNPLYYAVLFIQDSHGNMVFFTADDDLRESVIAGHVKGKYRYIVQLPSYLLKPGEYYLTVSLTQAHKTGGPHDRRDSVLAFEIVDHETRRGARNGYRGPAVVAPKIPWTLVPGTQLLPNLDGRL